MSRTPQMSFIDGSCIWLPSSPVFSPCRQVLKLLWSKWVSSSFVYRYTYVCALYVMWLWTVAFQCPNRPHENIWTRDTMATFGVVRGNPLVFPAWWVTNNGYLNCCFVCIFHRGLGIVSSPNLIRWVYCFQYNAWESAWYWKQSALGLVLGLRLGWESCTEHS